jgi:hypothetical protein
MNRRGFLKILTAAIAAPVIARVALVPELIVPGVERVVEPVTKAVLMSGEARFANAAFTFGDAFTTITEAFKISTLKVLPPGTVYQVRRVWLDAHQLYRNVGRAANNRPGWAVLWVTDAQMQAGAAKDLDGSEFMGLYRAGNELPEIEWPPRTYDEPSARIWMPP